MKSQALKFFPRESKLSTQEELFLSDFNVLNKERMANQRLESFAVYILLLMRMSEDENSGYYINFDQDTRNLLANKIGTDNKFLSRVVHSCLERGLFDKVMFQKYNILTSPDIQDKYFFGKQRCTKIQIVADYLYDFVYENYENVIKKAKIVNKNGEIVNKNLQITQNKTDTKTNTRDTHNLDSLSKFNQTFPEKAVKEEIKIPDYVNMDLLIEKIKQSDFIQKCPNLNLIWLIQKDNYDKVTSDFYTNRNFKPVKTEDYSKRDYSAEEINSLYTNLEDIKL